MERLFISYAKSSDGTLTLEEMNTMFNKLQIGVNKKELKLIFDDIDFDKKGYV